MNAEEIVSKCLNDGGHDRNLKVGSGFGTLFSILVSIVSFLQSSGITVDKIVSFVTAAIPLIKSGDYAALVILVAGLFQNTPVPVVSM